MSITGFGAVEGLRVIGLMWLMSIPGFGAGEEVGEAAAEEEESRLVSGERRREVA